MGWHPVVYVNCIMDSLNTDVETNLLDWNQ